jgi:hypothetical protein
MLVVELVRNRYELAVPAIVAGVVASEQQQRGTTRIECVKQ